MGNVLSNKKELKLRLLFIAGMIRWIREGNPFGLERVESRIDETCRLLYDETLGGYWKDVADNDSNVAITNTLRIICECRINEVFDRMRREAKCPLRKEYVDDNIKMEAITALESIKFALSETERKVDFEPGDFCWTFNAFREFCRAHYQVGNTRFGRGKYCGQLTFYHEVDYRLDDIIDNKDLEPHELELLLYLTAKRILKASIGANDTNDCMDCHE